MATAEKELSKSDVYSIVTDQIVAKLEEGVVPWHKPWQNGHGADGFARNLQSKRPYRGINQFLLSVSGYGSPFWTTYKACKKSGGQVRKGEKSTIVVFWKILKKEGWDEDEGKIVTKTIPLLRYYRVFNVEQCDGLEGVIPAPPEESDEDEGEAFEPIDIAQAIIDEMPNRPVMTKGGDRAYYRESEDRVNVPDEESFDSPEHFYVTSFHELVHATGHKSRLHRPAVGSSSFGTDPYADEELVAEMGAAFLAGVTGVSLPTIDNSASYIGSWLKQLKGDPKLVVMAAARAQKAADYIQGIKHDEKKEDDN